MKYSVGVDFGTLSGRCLLVSVENGAEVASVVTQYKHGVMSTQLPDGTPLGADWALQHPQDYLDVLSGIKQLLIDAKVSAADVVGVGVDFTACTILPTDKDGRPLCFYSEYENQPHAYVKLWKHHAAQAQANRLNEIAAERGEKFLARYGGKISSEWAVPKVMQLAEEAPSLYQAMDRWIEATDWVVWQLCGKETRSCCTAGYKGLWHYADGYPEEEFFAALNPLLRHFIRDKFSGNVLPLGAKAGGITAAAAQLTGLKVGTAVAVGNVDAHVALPAVGITDEGKLLMIMGTSTCHIVMGKEEREVEGMCGVTRDGVLAGYYGYEAGQSCVGDHFQWLCDGFIPEKYYAEAAKLGLDIQQYLSVLGSKLQVGESGLLALDWWNGNRSTLVDVDLTGLIMGMTLGTKCEEIYRALVEATAFGTRKIIDAFQGSGVQIAELYAAGGIAEKNSFIMQIYSDVTGRTIKISGSPQAPALGSAMFGAVAGGYFKDMNAAATVMAKVKDKVYHPIAENVARYDLLYAEYVKLYELFGKQNAVMKRLKKLKTEVKNTTV